MGRAIIANANATSHAETAFGSVAESVGMMADRAKSVAARVGKMVARSVDFATRDFQDIRIIANSMLDHTDLLAATVAEMSREAADEVKTLSRTDQRLKEHNDYVASECMSPDGFALHVHDFVNQQVEETKSAKEGHAVDHIFFLYNPGTVWSGGGQRSRG